ncbi:MAG: hypothetical protein L0G90_01410, partial [Corynebacterium glyciniphilum]|nr:hypothetical protein [Corynebacterium glyciniphilum]
RDLRAVGKTHNDIAVAVRRGEIFRITRDLYSTEEPDDLVRLKALSWARPEMVYTGDTAAILHDLAPMRWPAHGRVPRTRSRDGGELLTLTGAATRRTCRRRGVTTLTPLETAATAGSVALPARRALLERAYSGVKGNDRLAADIAALPPSVRAKATTLTDGLITGAASELELKAVDAVDRRTRRTGCRGTGQRDDPWLPFRHRHSGGTGMHRDRQPSLSLGPQGTTGGLHQGPLERQCRSPVGAEAGVTVG